MSDEAYHALLDYWQVAARFLGGQELGRSSNQDLRSRRHDRQEFEWGAPLS